MTRRKLPPIEVPPQPPVELTLYERIERGDFKNTDPYPDRPAKPPVLRKPVGDLTPEERKTVNEVLSRYEADMAVYENARNEWNRIDNEKHSLFQDALYAEHGVDPKLPITGLLWSQAWEQGHSSGMASVASSFDDLMPIYQEAIRMRDQAKNG